MIFFPIVDNSEILIQIYLLQVLLHWKDVLQKLFAEIFLVLLLRCENFYILKIL